MQQNQTDPPASVGLMSLLGGRWISQAISAAARLGVADAIGDQPATTDELARKLGVHGPTLRRLLRALVVSASLPRTTRDGSRTRQ